MGTDYNVGLMVGCVIGCKDLCEALGVVFEVEDDGENSLYGATFDYDESELREKLESELDRVGACFDTRQRDHEDSDEEDDGNGYEFVIGPKDERGDKDGYYQSRFNASDVNAPLAKIAALLPEAIRIKKALAKRGIHLGEPVVAMMWSIG